MGASFSPIFHENSGFSSGPYDNFHWKSPLCAKKDPWKICLPEIPGKSIKSCLWLVWVDGGAVTAAQTVRMDHLLCQECAEVVLMMFRWPAAVWCSVFDRGSLWGSSEVLSSLLHRPKLSKIDKYYCVKFCVAENVTRTV